ncbi:MAG: DUF1634 domain-containing protein [Bdellovibrionota bacterium]
MKSTLAVETLELKISYFLRYGVFISAFFLAVGWLGEFIHAPDAISHFQVYSPVSLLQMIQTALRESDIFRLSSLLGLALLVSLPIIRVFLTAYLFIRNRDWYLASMAIFVFGVLTISFFLGIDL